MQQRKYDAQLDVFGHARPIITARTGEQGAMFDTIDLPDVTYGRSVEQPTLDGSASKTGQLFVPRR